MTASLDHQWISWIEENILRGCNPEQLLEILLRNNFSITSIRKAMGDKFPAHSQLLLKEKNTPAHMPERPSGASALTHVTPGIDHAKLTKIRITTLNKEDGVERIDNPHIQLFTYNNFLSGAECDKLIHIIRRSLRPSTLTNPVKEDKYFRTSSTCNMSRLDEKLVRDVDERISHAIGIRFPFSEGIQGQHYGIGQEFKEHTDFFEPGTSEFAQYGGNDGNRTWTFMIYLKKASKGGETYFPRINKSFPGKKGQAIIWNNLNADGTPNRYTLHQGKAVGKGEKIIITKWFREMANPRNMFY